jgi:arylsulfatase A-like enzyme
MNKFVATWLLPLGWITLFRKLRSRLAPRDLDPRRYWLGEVVPSPKANVRLFREAGLSSASLTFNNETRDSTTLYPGDKISLPLRMLIGGWWRLGVASQETGRKVYFSGGLQMNVGGKRVAYVDAIPERVWSDVRLDGELVDEILVVANNSNVAIHLSHPVAEEEADPGEVQNIIVIILDSIVPDVLGAYRGQNEVSWTPNIDRFFAESVVYENCFSIAEWTLPSLNSILSARYPITHGYTDLRNTVPTDWAQKQGYLAELMGQRGYSTMACSTAKVFTPAFGTHSGFARFFYDTYPESGRTSRLITGRAIDHIEANRAGKNFLFLHYIDTHEPWIAPSYAENCALPPQRAIDPFVEYASLQTGTGDSKGEPIFPEDAKGILDRRLEARIREVDLHLQPLFDYLSVNGFDKGTALILTGDHGYAYPGGGGPLLADSRVRVPLLIKHHSTPAKKVGSLVNQGLDLGPTIAALGGAIMDSDVGKSLLPHASYMERQEIISESVFLDKYKVTVRSTEHTFHFNCKYEIEINTICLGSILSISLYKASTNEQIPPASDEFISVTEKMLGIVREHVVQHALAFKYSTEKK